MTDIELEKIATRMLGKIVVVEFLDGEKGLFKILSKFEYETVCFGIIDARTMELGKMVGYDGQLIKAIHLYTGTQSS